MNDKTALGTVGRPGPGLLRLWRSPALRWSRRGGAVLLTVLLVEYVVLPQLLVARQDLDVLALASPWLVVAALACEACSLLSYSALSRTALGGSAGPGYWTILRIDLTGLGASHLMVGGGAAAVGLRYRLLVRSGVEPAHVVASTAVETAMSVGALLILLITGVGLNLAAVHPSAAFWLALVSAGAGAAAVIGLRRGGGRSEPESGASVRRHSPTYLRKVVRQLAAQVRDIQVTPGLLGRYVGWALGNWVMDAMCLAVCLYAFGLTLDGGQLLWVYGLVNVMALVPVSPGGLGIVEGVMVPTLVAFGATYSVALLGVLAWRVAEYWLPIPVAGLAYLSLRLGRLRHNPQS